MTARQKSAVLRGRLPSGPREPGRSKKELGSNAAMRADPESQTVMKAEQAEKILEKAEIIVMHPTDFSALKKRLS